MKLDIRIVKSKYEKSGFIPSGDEFMEAGIRHVKMFKKLSRLN